VRSRWHRVAAGAGELLNAKYTLVRRTLVKFPKACEGSLRKAYFKRQHHPRTLGTQTSTMSGEKRPAANSFGTSQLVKRAKSDANINGSSAVAISNGTGKNGALIQAVPRTGVLQSPVMELTGHTGEIFAARFDPTGQYIASGSMDRSILLWRSTGACDNYGSLTGHKQAVLDLHWSRDSKVLFSASADMHLASWDVETGERIRRHPGHEEVINCMDVSKRGEEMLVSGSDDGYIGVCYHIIPVSGCS
jgi:Prp8 binding protein